MNNRIISLLSALTAIALAMAARGAFAAVGFTAPQLPESPYDDTEIATNFVISAQFDNARAFGVSLDFDATATNTLELAFGSDANSDDQIKAQFVKAGRFYHAEDMDNNYDWAFAMSGNDTNRFARVLRELAVENTNQTLQVLLSLRCYKTTESLPFLYSYSTNLIYGVDAVKSIFVIEGVNTNSFSAFESYLSLTNIMPNNISHDRSELCKDFLSKVFSDPALVTFRQPSLDMMLDFAKYRNTGHVVIDGALQTFDPSYKYSKRRLQVMRLSMERCLNSFHTNYISNVISELVAYPESELPD